MALAPPEVMTTTFVCRGGSPSWLWAGQKVRLYVPWWKRVLFWIKRDVRSGHAVVVCVRPDGVITLDRAVRAGFYVAV